MLESWPISRRINTGFVIVTLMLVGLAVFSQRAVGTLGSGYNEYQTIAKQNIAVTALIEDIFEARQASFQYQITPDSMVRQQVSDSIDDVLNGTEFLSFFDDSPSRLAEIETVLDEARNYKIQFIKMADALDAAIAFESNFVDRSAQLQTEINAAFNLVLQSSNPAQTSAAGRSLQALYSAILYGKRYLASTDADNLSNFTAQYQDFNTALDRLIALNRQDNVSVAIARSPL